MKKEQVKGRVYHTIHGVKMYAKGQGQTVIWSADINNAKEYKSLKDFAKEYPICDLTVHFEPIEESLKEEQDQGVILHLVTGQYFHFYSGMSGLAFTKHLKHAKKFNSFQEFCHLCEIHDAYGSPYIFVCLSKIIQVEEPKSSKTILQEAQDVVYGDRQADYGSVTQNFTTIAQLWSAVLGIKVSPEQVGLCMVQVKVAKQMNKPKRDNLVDICGYAACLEKMEIENDKLAF